MRVFRRYNEGLRDVWNLGFRVDGPWDYNTGSRFWGLRFRVLGLGASFNLALITRLLIPAMASYWLPQVEVAAKSSSEY